jgi:intracellular multiplication protein IcmN
MKYLLNYLLVCCLFILSGCANEVIVDQTHIFDEEKQAMSSQYEVTRADIAKNQEERRNLLMKLDRQGVLAFTVGETVTLSVLSDRLFNTNSANINEQGKETLDEIAGLLKTYDKVDVNVAGYMVNFGSVHRDRILSDQQAQKVVKYLWGFNIDTRMMVAKGEGVRHRIASNNTALGRQLNRRIDISFRYYPKQIL